MILNVDRSTPEHAVHSTGSMGGGASAGPATVGLKGDSGRVADPNRLSRSRRATSGSGRGGKGVYKAVRTSVSTLRGSDPGCGEGDIIVLERERIA